MKLLIEDDFFESPDNINFRHQEAKDTMYYPATSAKDMIELKSGILIKMEKFYAILYH